VVGGMWCVVYVCMYGACLCVWCVSCVWCVRRVVCDVCSVCAVCMCVSDVRGVFVCLCVCVCVSIFWFLTQVSIQNERFLTCDGHISKIRMLCSQN